MKAARILRILEFVGGFIPSVHELTMLVPAFFGLYYAARALGFDVDLEPEVVIVISLTFSCLVWITLNSWGYTTSRSVEEFSITHRTAGTQAKDEMDSIHARQCHSESVNQERRSPAGFP